MVVERCRSGVGAVFQAEKQTVGVFYGCEKNDFVDCLCDQQKMCLLA